MLGAVSVTGLHSKARAQTPPEPGASGDPPASNGLGAGSGGGPGPSRKGRAKVVWADAVDPDDEPDAECCLPASSRRESLVPPNGAAVGRGAGREGS